MSIDNSATAVAVAFSGGLDTSWLVARYAERGHPVFAITVDTGGWTDAGREALRQHALKLGATEHVLVDGRDPLYNDHIAPHLARLVPRRGPAEPASAAVEAAAE